jgi:hypothetical protein
MIRKILIGILLAGTSANAQSLYSGMFETKCKIQDKVVMKVKYFPLQDIRLLPSRFRENMQRIPSIPVLSIRRIWKEKDYIKISFPMSISTYKNVYINRKTVIKYGPIVLAGDLGDKDIYDPAPYSDPKKYNDYYRYDFNIPSDINTTISLSDIRRMEKKKDSLDFTLPDGRIIKPLFDIHRNRYVVYWDDKK